MAVMTEHEILLIERACERLVIDFAYYSDRKDYEALGALFAEEGSMTRPTGDPLVGRAAIIQSYRSRPANRITRHVCTNNRIDVESSDGARGLTYAVVYSANAGQTPEAHFGITAEARGLGGDSECQFVRPAEGWRFATRHGRLV